MRLNVDESLLDGLALVPVEEEPQRSTNDGHDDGEDAIRPTPADASRSNDPLASQAVDPYCDEPGRRSICDHESSIPQLRGIGDKDGNGEVEPGISSIVKDCGSRISFNVLTRGHHDEPEGHGADGKSETLRSSKVVDELGIRKFGQTGNEAGDDTRG